MVGSSEPYVVRFFSRSAPDPISASIPFRPGTIGSALGAAAFIAVVLGPPAVAIYALASIANL